MCQERAMRLPRMTTRCWMVLVLAIALSIECGRWGWRMSRANRLTAAHHADQERIARLGMMQMSASSPPELSGLSPPASRLPWRVVRGRQTCLPIRNGPPIEELSPTALQVARREAVEWNELVVYHSRLRRKYEWATWFPWLPVWADPPEPQ